MLTRGNSPGVECTACGTVAGNIANFPASGKIL